MSSNESEPAAMVSEKAKGKQTEQQSADMSMDEEESSGEESGPEEASNSTTTKSCANMCRLSKVNSFLPDPTCATYHRFNLIPSHLDLR